jgi:uncharacterized protein
MTADTDVMPVRVLGIYDRPFWDHLQNTGELALQKCSDCGAVRYPPGPVCHECQSPDYEWKTVSGNGEIMSWVIFHKGYLPGYKPPYNVIAVKLDEGPIIISNLEGQTPDGDWVGTRVRLIPVTVEGAYVLPRFEKI